MLIVRRPLHPVDDHHRHGPRDGSSARPSCSRSATKIDGPLLTGRSAASGGGARFPGWMNCVIGAHPCPCRSRRSGPCDRPPSCRCRRNSGCCTRASAPGRRGFQHAVADVVDALRHLLRRRRRRAVSKHVKGRLERVIFGPSLAVASRHLEQIDRRPWSPRARRLEPLDQERPNQEPHLLRRRRYDGRLGLDVEAIRIDHPGPPVI